MNKIKLICAAAAMMTAGFTWAVPAKQGLLQLAQPDGTMISVRKIGDERSHITLTPEGYPVTVGADGFYCFADFAADGSLKPTSVRVNDLSELSATQRDIVMSTDLSKIDELLARRASETPYSAPAQVISRSGGIGLMDDAFLGYKELKGLVILAQYDDVKFSEVSDREFFLEMLNREGFNLYDGTGSARDYFIDSSNGQFVPTFDVYGPVTLPHPMAYYGGNDANDNDKNAARMIYDACVGLDSEIDFSEYDIDGDGYVDNVFVFYAGYGEASYGSKDSVWPHQWRLSSARLSLTLDDVIVDKYACSNELDLDGYGRPRPVGIGTFVHEFSHVLGLPDLYVTNGSGYWTPGIWSVLDQGPYNNDGRTPPAYSIYERYSLGWIDPAVIDGPDTFTLEAVSETNQGCIIPTGSENEFFLLENRQQTGWDSYVPGHGMLIWHVDYNPSIWTRNIVNNQREHNYVDIEEACGTWYDSSSSTRGSLGDYAFPGSKGVTSFTDDTTPSMKTWAGRRLNLPVTDIEENDGVISFNVSGGRCDAAVPVVSEPAAVGDGWFEAAWKPADGAVAYKLTVKAFVEGNPKEPEIANFGSGDADVVTLPEGWELISSKGDVYTDEGNFGESAPSLKLARSGSGFMRAVYDTDIASVSFWMTGIATNSKSVLAVDGLVGNSWVAIADFNPKRGSGAEFRTDEIPAGVRRLRFIYNKSIGNIAVDDVRISFGDSGYVTLAGYDMLEVGDVTSYRVDRLRDDASLYTYSVCAVDANGRCSAWSDSQTVSLDGNAGIDDIITDTYAGVTVDGLDVRYSGKCGERMALSDICGRIVASAVAGSDGSAVITAPGRGLFVLSVGGKATKIIIR